MAEVTAGPMEKGFYELQEVLQAEADSFGKLYQSIADFDVVDKMGTAVDIFAGVGTALLTLFFCMEVFTYCAAIDFNGGIEGAIRIGMKLVVSAVIVQNVGNIVGALSGMLKQTVSFGSALEKIGSAFAKAAGNGKPIEPGFAEMNFVILDLLYFLLVIVMFVMFSMIAITLLGVVFETAILTAISPVALATLPNSQARSTGISFIKNFAAVSMQWGVLAICFKAYDLISSTLNFEITTATSGSIFTKIFVLASPILCVVMLSVTVSKASEITKRALGG